MPRPCAWAGGGPSGCPHARRRAGSPSLPRAAGPGRRGTPLARPAGPCSPRRSSGTRSLGACVDSMGLSLGCYRFAFFFFFCCFAFNFFIFDFFVCVWIFLPFLVPEGNGRGFTTTETERQIFCWSSLRGSLAEPLAGGGGMQAPARLPTPRTAPHARAASLPHRSSAVGPEKRYCPGRRPRGPTPAPAWLRPRGLQQPPPAPLSPTGGQRGCSGAAVSAVPPAPVGRASPPVSRGGRALRTPARAAPARGSGRGRGAARGPHDPALGTGCRRGRGLATLPAVPRGAGGRSRPWPRGPRQHEAQGRAGAGGRRRRGGRAAGRSGLR